MSTITNVNEVTDKLVSKLSLKAEEEEEEEPEAEAEEPEAEAEEEPEAEAEEEPEPEEEEEEDEEDLVDPAEAIKENCTSAHCQSLKDRLETCTDRVKSKTKTTETCYEEILDFYHCMDHCAGKEIFKHVK